AEDEELSQLCDINITQACGSKSSQENNLHKVSLEMVDAVCTTLSHDCISASARLFFKTVS
ncbi:hypothetical protein BaRGS_00018707, partial [Batillaria attramentaria]